LLECCTINHTKFICLVFSDCALFEKSHK